jgi:hypothetical protein
MQQMITILIMYAVMHQNTFVDDSALQLECYSTQFFKEGHCR